MSTETPSTPFSGLSIIIAGAVALVFLAMSCWLISTTSDWQQKAVVYNAVCAVAFSAFGVLLGSKVQEVNVTRAVQTAQAAVIDAENKGAAIKAAVKTLQGSSPDKEAGGGTLNVLDANRSALGILIDSIG